MVFTKYSNDLTGLIIQFCVYFGTFSFSRYFLVKVMFRETNYFALKIFFRHNPSRSRASSEAWPEEVIDSHLSITLVVL